MCLREVFFLIIFGVTKKKIRSIAIGNFSKVVKLGFVQSFFPTDSQLLPLIGNKKTHKNDELHVTDER